MKRIITIGREFGSGGRELGRRIAEKLEIAYYDQEIITEIAKRTALSEEYIRQIEEKRFCEKDRGLEIDVEMRVPGLGRRRRDRGRGGRPA